MSRYARNLRVLAACFSGCLIGVGIALAARKAEVKLKIKREELPTAEERSATSENHPHLSQRLRLCFERSDRDRLVSV
jgi:hypothetical protein